ncbi:helix-turn-helix domain-containing protein [Micromonospora echinofusca]|uniref:PucR family transcriptional regulator n=1 Tax=Micromonospora echinofusca TaxID=47858 RepID=A0ABS3W1H4_MICEH|nr:helix-turn-helix domain-containing protein [Micromonospora echinofusca]MBO4210627.1 PucR family transcriptional regulator [Micromonospora echinofusca]
MAVTGSADALAALLRVLAADRGAVEELVRAARTQSPEVARLPATETRRYVAALLAAGFAAYEGHEDPGARDHAEARRLGADRAVQGVSVAGLLRGVQAARARAVELVVQHGRAAGIPDAVLLEALLTIEGYAGAVERAVVDGYRAAERELDAERNRRDAGTRLLRRLLLGEPTGEEPDPLVRFGLRADGRYHCLVADPGDPLRVRALTRRLAGCGGVFGVVQDRLAGLTPCLPPAGLLDAGVLVVAAPARPLAEARVMHGLCVAALRVAAGQRLRGLHQVTDLAGETVLAAQPVLAELLSSTLLAALDPAEEFHRELASTALAWLDHGQRLDQTALVLHVHPNTVRYRLRRLHELTGLPPGPAETGDRWTVLQTVRWWWALRTWLDRR